MRILRDKDGNNPIMVRDEGKVYDALLAKHGDGLHAFLLARKIEEDRKIAAQRIEKAPAHRGPRLRVTP